MKWIKYTLLGLLFIVLAGGLLTYYNLKSMGIIPREDYDSIAPNIPHFERPAILVLNKTNGFIHVDALPAGDAMLSRIAQHNGWDIYITDNAASHNAADLTKFTAVVWNNVSGDVLTAEQRQDFRTWLEQGGGWVGLHAAGGDPRYKWDWYVDTLIGAQFVGHTMDPQFQDADVLVVDQGSGITDHLGSPWRVPLEEWYAFDRNPGEAGYDILLTLDEDSYITKGEGFFGNDRMEGEHPITWRHQPGDGRAFYTAIGHQAATYSIPEYQKMVDHAIRWVMGH